MTTDPIPIPITSLSEDVLLGIIKEYVLREGTDYGRREYSLEEKTASVRYQLERQEAEIIFDPETETCNIVKR
jgi:uncharacterized protein YheU (UPF0270 family)